MIVLGGDLHHLCQNSPNAVSSHQKGYTGESDMALNPLLGCVLCWQCWPRLQACHWCGNVSACHQHLKERLAKVGQGRGMKRLSEVRWACISSDYVSMDGGGSWSSTIVSPVMLMSTAMLVALALLPHVALTALGLFSAAPTALNYGRCY